MSFLSSCCVAGLFLMLASCRWLASGAVLESVLRSRRPTESLSVKVTHSFAQVVTVILLLTLLTLPFVNQRAKPLGFRHPAISFR
jgi:hypothetical protein